MLLSRGVLTALQGSVTVSAEIRKAVEESDIPKTKQTDVIEILSD